MLTLGLAFGCAAGAIGQTLYLPDSIGTSTQSGMVGIGTSTPSGKLSIVGGTNQNDLVVGESATTPYFRVQRYSGGSLASVVTGSSFGTLIQGREAAHTVIAIPANDSNDSFSIVGPSNYQDAFIYDRSLFVVKASGNVGVGTASPGVPFHVYNTTDGAANTIAGFESLRSGSAVFLKLKNLAYSGGNDYLLFADSNGSVGFHQANVGTRLSLDQAGHVGIGGIHSSRRFYVNEPSGSGIAALAGQYGSYDVRDIQFSFISNVTNGASHFYLRDQDNSDSRFLIEALSGGGTVNAFLVTSSGKVGIGTRTPSNALEVNGAVRAKEVIVESTGWPDYVFGPDYRLPSLAEVAEQIDTAGHLPDVPSAATVAERGIPLGEMQKTLLRKVEELTLYVIAQDRKLESQAREIEGLRAELAGLRGENR